MERKESGYGRSKGRIRHKSLKIVEVKTKMLFPKVELKKGTLKAKVKYPLVGGAELELGSVSKLKALVKVPFLFSAKLFGFLRLKKKNDKKV